MSSHNTKPRVPLIVDPDFEFLNQLHSDPKAQALPPVTAKNGKEAQLYLGDPNNGVSGVFVNPEVSNPNGLSVIRFAHMHRPATPVYVIYNKEPFFTPDELKKLGIQKAITKPVTYSELLSLVTPSVTLFDEEGAIKVAGKNKDTIDQEVSVEDTEFKAIRAGDFLAGSKSYFDVYVRLGSGRYLKLIQAGDAFSADRVVGYIKKGVSHFYIRREAQEHYIAYCDKLTASLLKSKKVSIELKTSQTLNQGEETLKFFKDQGLSEANIKYAKDFMNNVSELTKQLQPGRQPLLKGFLSNINSYEHGVATTMVASMLINSLRMTSADPVETVGLACLFHDIGLYKLDLTQFDEDETKMNDEQRKAYYTHPTVGAEILRTLPHVKPIVLQAVAQHHERRNKKGFPSKIGPGSISMVADIVGISDEFNRLLQRRAKNPKLNMVEELETHIFHAFSNQLVNEFKRIFLFADTSGKPAQKPPTSGTPDTTGTPSTPPAAAAPSDAGTPSTPATPAPTGNAA